MKIFRSIGLMLVFVASLLVGCTSDNVMTGSSQVENQEVVFNLFEHSISGLETRGDESAQGIGRLRLVFGAGTGYGS